jgi:hypothetical protein
MGLLAGLISGLNLMALLLKVPPVVGRMTINLYFTQSGNAINFKKLQNTAASIPTKADFLKQAHFLETKSHKGNIAQWVNSPASSIQEA